MIEMKNHVPKIALIAAMDEQRGIGSKGNLLCHLPADLKHFKELTSGHCVIMGRKTFESLPKGALPNRTNIVLTSDNPENYPGCIVVRSVEEALAECKQGETAFIIGGGEVYRTTIQLADTLYITLIDHVFEEADTFFPPIDPEEWEQVEAVPYKQDERHKFNFSFLTFVKTK